MKMSNVSPWKQRTARDWITAPWAIRLWLPIVALFVFYRWLRGTMGMFDPPRSPDVYEFWTGSNGAPVSLLLLVTGMLLGWGMLSLVEVLLCYFDRTEPWRFTRIALHLALTALLLTTLAMVRTYALAFPRWGPME